MSHKGKGNQKGQVWAGFGLSLEKEKYSRSSDETQLSLIFFIFFLSPKRINQAKWLGNIVHKVNKPFISGYHYREEERGIFIMWGSILNNLQNSASLILNAMGKTAELKQDW